MKKVILLVVIIFTAAAVYAQNYTVQEVTGRVERETTGGNWVPVNVGDSLRADTMIRTLIASNLTVKTGDQVLAVGPMQTGKLREVAGSASVIQIQGRVIQTDTGEVGRSTGRVTTASARAGDAASEIDLED